MICVCEICVCACVQCLFNMAYTSFSVVCVLMCSLFFSLSMCMVHALYAYVECAYTWCVSSLSVPMCVIYVCVCVGYVYSPSLCLCMWGVCVSMVRVSPLSVCGLVSKPISLSLSVSLCW